MLEVTPHGNRVLVEFVPFELAIELPPQMLDGKPSDQKMGKWIIRKVGEGRLMDNGVLVKIPYEVGQAILFDPRAKVVGYGNDPVFGDKKFAVVPVEDVIATVEGDPDLMSKKIVRATRVPELVH
jgi:co-chaperonin GroES (HSP10)